MDSYPVIILLFDEILDLVTKTVTKPDPNKIKMEDLARSGGIVEEGE